MVHLLALTYELSITLLFVFIHEMTRHRCQVSGVKSPEDRMLYIGDCLGSRMVLNRKQLECWLARGRIHQLAVSGQLEKDLGGHHIRRRGRLIYVSKQDSLFVLDSDGVSIHLQKESSSLPHEWQNKVCISLCVYVCVTKAEGERCVHIMMPSSCLMSYICPSFSYNNKTCVGNKHSFAANSWLIWTNTPVAELRKIPIMGWRVLNQILFTKLKLYVFQAEMAAEYKYLISSSPGLISLAVRRKKKKKRKKCKMCPSNTYFFTYFQYPSGLDHAAF